MNPLESKVRGGVIRVYENTDPDNPGVSVMYQPDGADFEIDLVYIENTDLELEKTDDPETIRIFVYDNVFTEDYQDPVRIVRGTDVRDMVRAVMEER